MKCPGRCVVVAWCSCVCCRNSSSATWNVDDGRFLLFNHYSTYLSYVQFDYPSNHHKNTKCFITSSAETVRNKRRHPVSFKDFIFAALRPIDSHSTRPDRTDSRLDLLSKYQNTVIFKWHAICKIHMLTFILLLLLLLTLCIRREDRPTGVFSVYYACSRKEGLFFNFLVYGCGVLEHVEKLLALEVVSSLRKKQNLICCQSNKQP